MLYIREWHGSGWLVLRIGSEIELGMVFALRPTSMIGELKNNNSKDLLSVVVLVSNRYISI